MRCRIFLLHFHAILKLVKLEKEQGEGEARVATEVLKNITLRDQAHALINIIEQGQLHLLAALVVDNDEQIEQSVHLLVDILLKMNLLQDHR